MRKTVMMTAVTLVAASVVFFGCSKSSTASSGGAGSGKTGAHVAIQFMTLEGGILFQAYQTVIADFEKANPNITVEATSVPSTQDFQTALKTKFAAGTPPDVYQYQDGAALTQFAALGYLYDMTDQPFIKNTIPENFRLTTYQGRIYGFPLDYQTAGLFVNMDVMKKYPDVKVPENWGEFVSAMTQLKKEGLTYPLEMAGKNINNVAQFDFQYIAEVLLHKYPDYYKDLVAGKTHFTDPMFQTMFEKFAQIKQFMSPDSVGVDQDEATKRFIKGEAAFWIAHGSFTPRIRQLGGPDFNFEVVPSVMQDNTADRALLIGPVGSISIVKQSKYIDADLAFTSYFTSKPAAEVLVKQGGMLSDVTGVTAMPDPAYNPLIPWVSGQPGTHMVPVGPDLVWVPGIKDVMKSITQKWFMGTSIHDVLAEWQSQHEKLLQANPEYVKNINNEPY
ncbi:MAG TPA: extracellular solute-binding protein [Spirochaetia bacterium]|nr:extracellular solute-binding protein [Spirochaetia bacterium]